jgi:hypothetical protein
MQQIARIRIEKTSCEKMAKQPLFFVRLDRVPNSTIFIWKSIDLDAEISISAENFGPQDCSYCLCIIDEVTKNQEENGGFGEDLYDIYFHDASASNENDIHIILKSCIDRDKNDKDDSYAYAQLLWILDKQGVNIEVLSSVIRRYDKQLLDRIRIIGRCLSKRNQDAIQILFNSLGEKYEIYMPEVVVEAFSSCNSAHSKEELNLFQLIDEIIEYKGENITGTEPSDNNPLIQVQRWLHSEGSLSDYAILNRIFSLVAEPVRLNIIKRYLHDVRVETTPFDIEQILQFKNNRFGEFSRYRYSIERPVEPIILTVPLLCDIILTLHNTHGEELLTFDGVLDLAIQHSDRVSPSVVLQLDRLITTCANGAIYNSGEFKGFIDYQVIQRMNTSLLADDDILLDHFHQILNRVGQREKYPVCKYGDDQRLTDSQFANCSKVYRPKEGGGMPAWKLDCYSYKEYNDKWSIEVDNKNSSLVCGILADYLIPLGSSVTIDINKISLDSFRSYILSLPSRFEKISKDEFLIPSSVYKDENMRYELMLIEWYSDALRMRIFPQEGVLVGQAFDIFNFREEELKLSTQAQTGKSSSTDDKKADNCYLTREKEEVKKRTIESLSREFGYAGYNGLYFEMPFDQATLDRITKRYYFKESFVSEDDIKKHEFLTTYRVKQAAQYCAPKLSEVNNPAIDLPFFWCRGRECFRNNLGNQTLSTTDDWHKYSLYHMIEIIGYPKLHPTEAGNEAEDTVRKFIGLANKAMQKYEHLKCRVCGHLLFPSKSSSYNSHNRFSCINPTCPERRKEVYLTFCHKCKKSFIDARDTKQCPNGWYICPQCLSCCSDKMFERQAQREYLSPRGTVSYKTQQKRGYGHNDKEEYFCPTCGSRIEIIKDEHGHLFKWCSVCKKRYEAK